MKLTTFTDYSLRVLIALAVEGPRRVTIAEIARSFGISENHLVKVVHFLGRQGWIDTVRGKGGGLRLALPAERVNVGRVVRDTEGIAQLAACFADGDRHCVIADVCRLKGVLGEAARAFYGVLDGYTLADLVRQRHAIGKTLMMRAA